MSAFSETQTYSYLIFQAKEPADDLVEVKKEIDTQVEEKKKEAKEFEIKMRQKASTVGNIVGKNAPVSLTEVRNLQMGDDLEYQWLS